MPIPVTALASRLALGVVAVVGAGLSMGARYPNTYGLNALLWDAIDADPEARAGLAHGLGETDQPAKTLIGDDFGRWDSAWTALEESPTSRARFQNEFANLDATRSQQRSPSHEGLAQLVHAGVVECVISLNWDRALEYAYERLYGTALPAGVLYKPHGDVNAPHLPWVLPHRDGHIGPDLAARIAGLVADHPRTLMIVGYSERDKTVVEQLIAPLDAAWRVCRIGPSADGEDDVTGTSDAVLPQLAAPYAAREQGSAWTAVTAWGGSRGLHGALEGRRLEARDVLGCPRLHEADDIAQALRRDHAVIVNGETGTGKSITAYQALHSLAEEGREVLRLRDRSRGAPLSSWFTDLTAYPHRKVLFVDDAQDLPPDMIRELAETATADQLVLVVGIDNISGGTITLTLQGDYSVAALAAWVGQNRAQTYALVTELDDRVGDQFGHEPFEHRLAAAARQGTPWQFFFTLTGGWRRMTATVDQVRGDNRADLALLALAVAQIASMDSGVTIDDLAAYTDRLGRDRDWLASSLAVLEKDRLAICEDRVWRCAHLRAAHAIVNRALHAPTWPTSPGTPNPTVTSIASASRTTTPALLAPTTSALGDMRTAAEKHGTPTTPRTVPPAAIAADRADAATLINTAIDLPTTALRGITWLIAEVNHERNWVLRTIGVRSAERELGLVVRALATPPEADTAMAAQLIERLAWTDPSRRVEAAIWDGIDAVIDWIRHLTPQNGWALGALVNHLSNSKTHRERLASLLAGLEPATLAQLPIDGGWPHIFSTTQAVDRITQAADDTFRAAVVAALDEPALAAMLPHAPDLPSIEELLYCIFYLNTDMALRLLDGALNDIAARISQDPLRGHAEAYRIWLFVLGHTPAFLGGKGPDQTQQALTARLAAAIDPDALARSMTSPSESSAWMNYPHFLEVLAHADPGAFADVVARLDLDALEATLVEQLPAPGQSLLNVLLLVADTRQAEVHRLLERHTEEFDELDPLLALTHPQLAVDLLRCGLPVDLGLADENYDVAADMLDRIRGADPEVAAEVVDANAEAFRAGLARNAHPAFIGLSQYLDVADRVHPGACDAVLSQLPATVVESWKPHMELPDISPEVLRLVARVSGLGDTPAAESARALLDA